MYLPKKFGLAIIIIFVLVFANSARAEILDSDLNNNGTNDSDESEVVVNASATLLAGEYHFNNLIITNGATLTLQGDELSTKSFKGVKINAKNITVESEATISADRQGYRDGPGAPTEYFDGAGYEYGSAIQPTDLGSGGGGGNNRGGGAIWMEVSGSIKNNGLISATGNSSSSGGSIYVVTDSLNGTGTWRANGGSQDIACPTACAGGGGGRIALHYQTSSFMGVAEARGACFLTGCRDGTVGLFDELNNDLLIKSQWRFRAEDSPLTFNNIFISNNAKIPVEPGADITANNIFVDGASAVTLSGEETIKAQSLSLAGFSLITVRPEKTLYLEISNITVEAGSKISADGLGFSAGPGSPDEWNTAGASYGGKGGGSLAKPTYGSAEAPVDFGSGAQSYRPGGGAIRIVANETFKNDGVISASAIRPPVSASSTEVQWERASGGSIYVTAGKLSGAGTFRANGGNGAWPYSGIAGGGGRIAIYYNENNFTGAASVKAGVYCFYGCKPAAEDGTVVMEQLNVEPARTPVVIVPGVMGTEIFNGIEKLWLNFALTVADIGDEFLDALAFSDDLIPVNNELTLGGIITKVTGLDYSHSLIEELETQGYEEGVDLFTLPYDWRYGVNAVNIQKLKKKIADIKVVTGSEKFDVIAHSTGGLLVKKYIIENITDHHIDKAVFVGVPNTGAPKAIKTLISGDNFGNPFLSQEEMKKLAKNFPVVYDLAPSKEYYENKGSFVRIIHQHLLSSETKDLTFNETQNFLTLDHKLNQQAVTNASNLHTEAFDNFDLRTANVDLYNIVGCKAGTIGRVIERRVDTLLGGTKIGYLAPEQVPGDGTVPLESATNLPVSESNKYFALKASHGIMLTQDGIRQQIINILSDDESSLQNAELVTQDIGKCKLNGRAIAVYSPVSIDVIDQNGNHLGLASDGVSIENNIPNANFEVMGEEKFVYLPDDEGQTYKINLQGTGIGTFTITDTSIEDNEPVQEQSFIDIPVTTQTQAEITLNEDTQNPELNLDVTGDGVSDFTIQPGEEFDPITYLQILQTTITSLDLPQAKKIVFSNRVDNIIKSIEDGKINLAELKANKFKFLFEKQISKEDPKKPKPKQLSKTDAQLLLDMFNKLLDNIN